MVDRGDLQANEKVDNVHQNDYTRNDPQLNNGLETISHSFVDLNINDKVDINELYVSWSSRDQKTSSSDLESETEDEVLFIKKLTQLRQFKW